MPAGKHPPKSASRCSEGARPSPENFRFELKQRNHNISDKAMLADLRRVARLLRAKTLTGNEYRAHSKFGSKTIADRFGSWNIALKKAGLVPRHHYNVPVAELFENLEKVWRTLGRQPTQAEMVYPLSKYGVYAYEVRYHGFHNALAAFVKWKAGNRRHKTPTPPPPPVAKKARRFQGGRKVSLRLRFQILNRDHFTCRACGRSPANERGVRLHVDHIVPWSAGGETVAKNLQTLCQQCNLGKSNR